MLNPACQAYLDARVAEAHTISDERREQLQQLGSHIREMLDRGACDLNFVCTHNSRRSQLSQVWAAVAADALGLDGVRSFSSGTEATALHANAAAALARAGLEIRAEASASNPIHRVSWRSDDPDQALECFSKTLTDSSLPSNYLAVMTCSEADAACPVVPAAAIRFPLTFSDPKVFDATPQAASGYDERCAQIARELHFSLAHACQR